MRRWRGWRSLLIIGPYVLVVGAGFLGLHQLEVEAHHRCVDRRTDREVLRQVVDIATTSSSGSRIDLTIVPGFADLDANTQAFITNLSAAINSAPPASRNVLHDELLDRLPPINC